MSSRVKKEVVSNKLVEDFLEMVNNPSLSDMILVCKDGIQVHACRMVLAARSLFFSQMLLSGKAESRETSFALPTFTSSVMLIVLKFLYAGVILENDIIDKTLNLTGDEGAVEMPDKDKCQFLLFDWKLLLKVVHAARFLLLDRLHQIVLGKLSDDLPCKYSKDSGVYQPSGVELERVACALTALCDTQELRSEIRVETSDFPISLIAFEVKSTANFCSLLTKILASSELSAVTLFRLSKEAFYLYLTMTKTQETPCYERWQWSLAEYMKLREILMWCAVWAPNGGIDLESVGQYCLPGREITVSYLQRSVGCDPVETDSGFDFTLGRETFARSIVKGGVRQFLPMVNLFSIHPELLVNIVEPLNVLDGEDLCKIYRVQAVRASRRLRERAQDEEPVV